MSTNTELSLIVAEAIETFSRAENPAMLEEMKSRYIGKSGKINAIMKTLGSLSVEDRKQRGIELNQAKDKIEVALQEHRTRMADAELQQKLAQEALDVSLPGRRRGAGSVHPISRTMERIEQMFASMGFELADGPEIETDWFSFTALNNPENHPARSMQDTFYLEMVDEYGKSLNLRPHTSPMQIRHARAQIQAWHEAGSSNRMPDIRVIAPGRTYRVDNDATHSPMFHQCEGLWLGESVSFADLKSVLHDFYRNFFETEDLDLRFRPSYFPFTEPSAEVDIAFRSGPLKGRWLEVAGCGQVHPIVVQNYGLDPEDWIGFAFGMGLDRLTMLRYGVADLRLFFDGDIRFLSQFSDSPSMRHKTLGRSETNIEQVKE